MTPSGDQAKSLALRLYRMLLFAKLEGGHVIMSREVTRQGFSVSAGSEGILLPPCLDDEGRLFIAVKLSCPPPGSEPFEGELHWMEGQNIDEFESDCKVRSAK